MTNTHHVYMMDSPDEVRFLAAGPKDWAKKHAAEVICQGESHTREWDACRAAERALSPGWVWADGPRREQQVEELARQFDIAIREAMQQSFAMLSSVFGITVTEGMFDEVLALIPEESRALARLVIEEGSGG